jgi:hypothetical protein
MSELNYKEYKQAKIIVYYDEYARIPQDKGDQSTPAPLRNNNIERLLRQKLGYTSLEAFAYEAGNLKVLHELILLHRQTLEQWGTTVHVFVSLLGQNESKIFYYL